MPGVSVIVVNFNRVNLLRECLCSLREQSFVGAEWIVVDNGSTDGSAEMVEAEFPQAKVLRSRTNLGFCAGNNLGIAAASGEYIALLNNDAVAEPEWIAALVREAEQGARVGMVASKILVAGKDRVIDKVGHGIYWDGQNRGVGSGEVDRGQYDDLREVLWPDGCAALYRKSMLDEIGCFDEDFFAYADDAELGMRGRSAGWTARFAAGAVVHHHRGSTMGKWAMERIRLIERNRVWLAMLHFPWWLLLLNPLFYGMRLGAGLLAGIQGQGEAGQVRGIRAKIDLGLTLLRADLEAVLAVGKMWPKRKAWREKRLLGDRDVIALIRQHQLSLTELSKKLA